MSEPVKGRVVGQGEHSGWVMGQPAGKDVRRMRNVTPGHEAEPMPETGCPEWGVLGCLFAGTPHEHRAGVVIRGASGKSVRRP